MGNIIKNILELREKLGDKYEEKLGPKPQVSIEATNLDDLYFQTILSALKYGRLYKIDNGSFAGSHRIEFDHANLTVKNPTTRPLAPQSRPGIPVSTNDDKIEEYFLSYLMDGSLEPNEHYKYSSWIVGIPKDQALKHRNIPRGTRLNQLEWSIEHFVNKGYGTNHCAIAVGCAEGLKRYDWGYKNETERGTSECLRDILLKVKDNKLNLTCVFRSWDLVAGLPENLGGLAMVMEYAVDEINARKAKDMPEIKPGVLYANSDGLHIYEHDLDLAKLWVGLEENKNSF